MELNIRSLIEHALPPSCLLCLAPKGPLCPACLTDLPWLGNNRCSLCALPTHESDICGHCLKEMPAFDRTDALFSYTFPIDRIIQQLKYREGLTLAPVLGGLMAQHLKIPRPDLWLPMPLHANRLKERGFNQAVEIARELSATTDIPMQVNWATRERDTPPQAGLKRDARRKNMRGAFNCNAKVGGLHVGIVDDVMTTGSTLDALAQALKQAGAREVSCVVAARA